LAGFHTRAFEQFFAAMIRGSHFAAMIRGTRFQRAQPGRAYTQLE